MVRALDQQSSQVGVTGFGNSQLRVMAARLIASRPQSDIATDIATLLKSMLVSDGEHKGDGRECANRVEMEKPF